MYLADTKSLHAFDVNRYLQSFRTTATENDRVLKILPKHQYKVM